MAISQKYGRTYHYPFSPGTTSDDRIAHDYWENLQHIPLLVHTEKLDGENNCLQNMAFSPVHMRRRQHHHGRKTSGGTGNWLKTTLAI